MKLQRSFSWVLAMSLLLAFTVPCTAQSGPSLGAAERQDQSVPHTQHDGNLQFVSQIGGEVNDVVVRGHYAYAAIGPRVVILDVGNPAHPAVVGRTQVLPDVVWSLAIQGNYIYALYAFSRGWGAGGLCTVDILDLAHPNVASDYDLLEGADSVVVVDSRAFVASWDGLYIVDISDPWHPAQTGRLAGLMNVQGIAVAYPYVYLVDGWNGLHVIDVSDLAQPIEVGSYEIQHCSEVAVSGRYAYLSCGHEFHVADISTPRNPSPLGSCSDSLWALGEIALADGHAYVAELSGGLNVFDVSQPTDPVAVASHETPGWGGGIAVSGDYAYVANGYGGLHILMIYRADHLVEAGSYREANWSARRVGVVGQYAYVAAENAGLRILDVSRPQQPVEVGSYNIQHWDSVQGIAVVGHYAYIAADYQGLIVLDITDPLRPVRVGGCSWDWGMKDLTVAGDYAYVVHANTRGGSDAGLYVVDVSNPSDPTWVGFSAAHGEFVFDVRVAVDGKYAYIAENPGMSGENQPNGLRIVDISVPSQPGDVAYCGIYDEGGYGYARSVAVQGHHAYVTDGNSGLCTVNISNPLLPAKLGCYATPAYAEDVAVAGSYAYVADRHAHDYIANRWAASSLRILDVSQPEQPVEVTSHHTPGYASDVAVAGSRIYLASGDGGLIILQFDLSQPYRLHLPLVLKSAAR